MKKKNISPTASLLFEDENIGLLINKKDKLLLLFPSGDSFEFNTISELEKVTGKITEFKPKNIVLSQINGYDTKHKDPQKVAHESLPCYNIGSNTIYVAGYYAVQNNSSKKFSVTFCPKLSTIINSNYFGPFKTRFEAMEESSLQNNKYLYDSK